MPSSKSVLIDSLLSSSSSLLHSLRWRVRSHHIYIAESAFATTTAATDADDVATMSIESEGNFNLAMVNMLRGAAGVVSLRNNKDSFNDVECKENFDTCMFDEQCCEYK